MQKEHIYLDHSASTPVDARVLDAMLPYFGGIYGNPSGNHEFARQSEKAVEDARETVAGIFNCQPQEVVFTGCGTESDNLAIRGATLHALQNGQTPHLLTCPVEHSAVSRTVRQQSIVGADVAFLPIDRDGCVSSETLHDHLRDETTLVSLIYANNEIGTVMPIADLAEITHEKGALFHTDAVQAVGQLSLDVQALNVDMLSISAHKFYGPKGVGALYVRDGVQLVPSQSGGSHEEGRRSGTLNVPLIVGLAKALELAYAELDEHTAHYQKMRDRLVEGVLSNIADVELTGHAHSRLPSHVSFAFKHVDGNKLLMYLDNQGIGASSGSACKTGNPEPSDVLTALGYDDTWALGGLRLTVGRQTTEADIDYVLQVLPEQVAKIRKYAVKPL